MALGLRAWSDDVIAFFNGPANLSAAQRRRLARCGVQVCEKPIARLAGRGRKLRQVVLVDGTTMPRDALFFNTAQHDRSVLLQQLGCAFGRDGRVRVDRREQTGVPGLFVAGDVLREVQFVIVAAGHGATAAVGIHQYLQSLDGFTFDDLKRHPKGTA
jgi:thioredoxin reductase